MAIEKRQTKSGIHWRAYWNNPFTRKREVGPWEESEAEASKLSDFKKWQIKHERDSFAPEELQPSKGDIIVSELLLAYCAKPDMRKTSRETITRHASQLSKKLGKISVKDLTHAHFRAFEDGQRESGITQNTIYTRLAHLRAAINWAIECERFPGPNPMAGYKIKKGQTTIFIPPTPKEIEALLQHAPDHLIRAISMSYYLGVRVGPSELLGMRWDQVDLDAGTAIVVSAHKKGLPWRRVPLKPEFVPVLRTWKDEDSAKEIPYCIHYAGKPISTIKKTWGNTKKRAGITRKLRPYDLRHAFATYALEAGADIGAVAQLMGHRDTTMIHKHYQHVLDTQTEKAISGLPAVHFEVHKKRKSGHKKVYPEK